MKNLRKYILIINLLFIAIAGIFLGKMTSVVYRYKRMNAFMESENIYQIFMNNINFNIIALWTVWLGIVIVGIYLLVLEYKRNDN